MGGKLLSQHGTKPLRGREAVAIGELFSRSVHSMLSAHGINCQIRMLKSYADKPEYSDVDLMLTRSSMSSMSPTEFSTLLSNRVGLHLEVAQPYPNADMFGIAYPLKEGAAQVDFILIDDDSFDFASTFLDYNGLGKFFNLVAKDLGKLKLGRDGLFLVVKDKGIVLGEVTLTKDPDKALSFLGYDVARYRQGFATKEAVFEYAVSSPHFSKNIIRPENRNAKSAADTKRPFYQDFLVWMDEQDLPETRLTGGDWVELALEAFPGSRQAIDDMRLNHQTQIQAKAAFKSRFNGSIVTRLTGIKGEKLGLFIESFKKQMASNDLESFVSQHNDRTLHAQIIEHADDKGFSAGPSLGP